MLIAFAAVGVGCAIYAVETFVFRSRHRFVENPTEAMMRALGLAHFIVGWLFLFTSPRLHGRMALARLIALTALGAALCLAFALAGGGRNPFVLIAFYGFFLIHEVRDETNWYRTYDHGDAPAAPALDAFFHCLGLTVSLLMLLVLAAALLAKEWLFKNSPALAGTPPQYLLAGWTLLLVATVAAGARTWLLGRGLFESPAGFAAAHRPLLLIYGGLLAVLVLGSLLGSVGFNLIILIHVTTWLVHVPYQLGRRRNLPFTLWNWLRGTPAGFVTLHLSVAIIILALMALRVHLWGRVGVVSVLLAGSSFPYWSVMHIAMSYWRGR